MRFMSANEPEYVRARVVCQGLSLLCDNLSLFAMSGRYGWSLQRCGWSLVPYGLGGMTLIAERRCGCQAVCVRGDCWVRCAACSAGSGRWPSRVGWTGCARSAPVEPEARRGLPPTPAFDLDPDLDLSLDLPGRTGSARPREPDSWPPSITSPMSKVTSSTKAHSHDEVVSACRLRHIAALIETEPNMPELSTSQMAGLHTGQAIVAGALANVLILKGIVTREEIVAVTNTLRDGALRGGVGHSVDPMLLNTVVDAFIGCMSSNKLPSATQPTA
jgi:hypothetical protein